MLAIKEQKTDCQTDTGKKNRHLSVSGFYADHAVFQHGKLILIRGKATPETRVDIRLGNVAGTVIANGQGDFSCKLPPMLPAENLTLTISSGTESLTFTGIAIGNVYLLGGQSNMEFPLREASPSLEAIAPEALEHIHCFSVPGNSFYGKASAINALWHSATPETAMDFSALGMFFAAELYRESHIPVGLISACRGGVNIESFVSEYSLLCDPDYSEELLNYESGVCSTPCDAIPDGGKLLDETINKLFPQDPGTASDDVFAAKEIDDSSWDSMFVPDSWTQAGHNHAGIFWFRKHVILPENAKNLEFTLHLGSIDKSDRTFVNGKFAGSTGSMRDMRFWNTPRIYHLPPGIFQAGDNVIALQASSLLSICADGGLIGPEAEMFLESADNSIKIPLAGQWQMREVFDAGIEGMTCMRSLGPGSCNSFHCFYDNVISPMAGTAIAGVLWYQGEANAICMGHTYRKLLEAMIGDWRRNFCNPELHFCIIQLPEFQTRHYFAPYATWPLIREAQHEAALATGSSLVVTLGKGDAGNIHPANKLIIAKEAAEMELLRMQKKPAKLPFLQATVKDKHALFLKFSGELDTAVEPAGFAIAGQDMIVHPAQCRFTASDTIEVWSDEVDSPVAAWYAWAENPLASSLTAADGRKISPFRTALDHSYPQGRNLIHKP